MMHMESDKYSPRGDQRILYVSDPSTIARKHLPDPVQEDDLRRWVDMVAASGVDLFDQEVFSQGWTAYWQSAQYEYDRRPQHRRFLPLLDAGIQPLDILIDQSHRRGMGFIAGFRLNDGHAYQARKAGVGIAAFIEQHPQFQLKDMPSGIHFEETEPLDFSFAEVRAFTLGVIREVVERFAVDGVELCMRDAAYFPDGTGPERAPLLTSLIEQIRTLLDERGAVVGKKLSLGVRVHPTIEDCAILGVDAPTWISQGFLDYISPQDMMYADFNLPYAAWAALTRKTNCMLYPGLQPWASVRARHRMQQQPLQPANMRALAHSMYNAGADGMAIYNHFVPTLWRPPFYPQAMQIFHQLRDPKRLARGERHYTFDPTWSGETGFGGEAKYNTGIVKANQLTLERHPGTRGEYQFYLYEDLAQAYGATLIFRGVGLSATDELEVSLNGQVIPTAAINRTAQSNALAIDGEFVREVDGTQVPCEPELGRLDFRPQPGPVFSTRWFSLLDHHMVYGENVLAVMLLDSDPLATQPIVIDELEIWVEPH